MSSSTPAKKTSKAKKPSTHAPYSQMIVKAISALDDKKGSSRQAVSKYIRANNKIDVTDAAHNARMRLTFKKLVATGALVANKGSFKLSAKNTKPKAATKKSAAKKSVVKTPKKPKAKSSTPVKKPSAKKSSAKKSVSKTTSKKPAVKKSSAKKSAAKKSVKKPAKK